MQENVQRKVLTENVPSFREHMGNLPICSRNEGTLHDTCTILSTNNADKVKTMQYKFHTFKLKDGYFLFDGLNFKLPQKTKITTFERVTLSLGIPLQLDDTEQEFDMRKNSKSFRNLLHVFTLLALKDLGIISNSFSISKQYNYGENVFELYLTVVSGSGQVSSKQKNMRWINDQDTKKLKALLFTTSKSMYRAGSYSMKYIPTDFADNVFELSFNFLKAIDFKHSDLELQILDFIVELKVLKQIKLRDVMLLLGDCIGYQSGFVIRPKLTDYQQSRIYSVFTNVSSRTRKILGFYNYDIGAALQTICLRLVKNSSQYYPIHTEYVANKINFRNKIQEETGKDEKWVKKELSKINNLDQMPEKYNHYPTLVAYYKEALRLRKEIIDTAEPAILSRARDCAKIKYKPIWTKGQKEPQFIVDGKKESSIFFFIWTQWERQIREIMMSCFSAPSACHQVHDAVYSKQIIKPQIIESKVLDATGFNINIFVD